jgi:hypothetical protein
MIPWLAVAAMAQTLPAGVPTPDLDAQLYRPPIDAKGLLWADTARGIGPGFSGRAVAHYAHRPFAYQPPSGDPVLLLASAATLDLIGAYAVGPVRFGLDLPVLYAAGDLSGAGVGLGDVAVDARLTAVDAGILGVGLSGRLGLPTTTVAAPVGTPGVHGEVAAIIDADVKPVLVAANIGMLFQPASNLIAEAWDEQLVWRLGGAVSATDAVGISADLAGSANLRTLGLTSGAAPMEALIGAYGDVGSGIRLQGGVGRGLTPGIGSSQLRVVAMIATVPSNNDDPDNDGLIGAADACPREAEDLDGVRDSDGCPDLEVEVRVTVTTKGGGAPEDVQLSVQDGTANQVSERTFLVPVDDAAVTLTIEARGFETATRKLQPGQTEATIALEPRSTLRIVQVSVTDADGAAVAMPRVWVDGKRLRSPASGIGRFALLPGMHRVVIDADGYGATYVDPTLTTGSDMALEVALGPPLVIVTEGLLTLPRPVAAADAELVKALAATILVTPELGGVRLVGPQVPTEALKNALIAAGVGRALVTTTEVAEAPPLAGVYDVEVAP